MNSYEIGKLFNQLFVCFPSFKTWYNELASKDQTYQVWTKNLSTVNFVDCLEVLDNWTSGKSKPPAGFEREQTIYKLAAAAREIQLERDRWANNEKILAQADRKKYEPIKFDTSMKAAYEKILTRLPSYKAGEMTWDEWVEWCSKCALEVV